MSKYIFPLDNLTIVDPSIVSIDEDKMVINNKDKTISLDVVLTDPSGSQMSPINSFMDIPRDAPTWDDCDVLVIVNKRLEEFKIEE